MSDGLKMKISNIRILKMEIGISNWLLLIIETNNGIIGWGDMSDSCHDDSVANIAESILKPALIGKNPLNIIACENVMTKWKYPVLNNVRMFAIVRSALNQALVDITAKYHNIPLYKMYGGNGNNEIELYANLNNAIRSNRTPEALYQQGLNAKKAGFKMVKCTPFDEVNPYNADNDLSLGFERFKALTEVWEVKDIALDCHQRFGRQTLGVMVEEVISEYGNPYWIEDPVPVLDYETIKLISYRYPSIRWAAGEDSFTVTDIMRTTASTCYDVIMPDVKYIGGPTVIRGIIGSIEGMGCKVTMHNPSGIIATAHSAHLTSICGGLPLEFPFGAVEERQALSTPHELIKDGKYYFNDEAGIGISISQDAFKEYAFEYIGSCWKKY